ncbi:unnamed protein product [Acanthoscelides obtectus]|uniref:Uncharacterized protein n=1 Tax=Acanthoscelides obtectus TaxID=200917 RepID=A0A9P0M7F1_ACAOB|nr:unnamed protein product [Acanthoscelides obtectus]CAK1643647.1 hypothetical protein AOBTE_LOCUS13619 [Acanthoscelides obtectus]
MAAHMERYACISLKKMNNRQLRIRKNYLMNPFGLPTDYLEQS